MTRTSHPSASPFNRLLPLAAALFAGSLATASQAATISCPLDVNVKVNPSAGSFDYPSVPAVLRANGGYLGPGRTSFGPPPFRGGSPALICTYATRSDPVAFAVVGIPKISQQDCDRDIRPTVSVDVSASAGQNNGFASLLPPEAELAPGLAPGSTATLCRFMVVFPSNSQNLTTVRGNDNNYTLRKNLTPVGRFCNQASASDCQ